jgi:hypothetical protein
MRALALSRTGCGGAIAFSRTGISGLATSVTPMLSASSAKADDHYKRLLFRRREPILARFSALSAHEDDPERALRAALDMIRRAAQLRERWPSHVRGAEPSGADVSRLAGCGLGIPLLPRV